MSENQKKIWITGASSGIGKALAEKFASKGWKVAISARREEILNEMANDENIFAYPLDVTNQEQIKDLAKIVDIMIIIGSFTSANSMRLTSLSKHLNANTFQVTDESEIEENWFADCNSVGISAGASTPDYLITNIKNKIERIGNRI